MGLLPCIAVFSILSSAQQQIGDQQAKQSENECEDPSGTTGSLSPRTPSPYDTTHTVSEKTPQ